MPHINKNVKEFKMNFLPLILLAVALGGDKAKSLAEFLSHIDFKSFAPVLKILGFSDKMLETLCSDEFSEMLSGEINAATITKILSGLTRGNSDEKGGGADKSAPPQKKSNFLSPIESVAPTEIEQTLGAYFS